MYYALQLRYITNSLLVPLQECPCYLNIGVDFYSRQKKYFKILHRRGIQYPSFSKGILSSSWRWNLACLPYLWLLVYPKTGEQLKVNFLTMYGTLPSLKGKVNSSPVQLQPYLGVGRFNLCVFEPCEFQAYETINFVQEAVFRFFYLFPHPVNTHLNL